MSAEKQLLEKVSQQAADIVEQLEGKADTSALSEVKESIDRLKSMNEEQLAKHEAELSDMVEKHNAAISALEGKLIEMKESGKKDGPTLREDIRKGWEAYKGRNFPKATGERVAAIKAAEVMVEGTTNVNGLIPQPRYMDVLNSAPNRSLSFIESLGLETTDAPAIIYMDKTNEEGAPATVADGGSKPLRSFRVTEQRADAYKIAAYSTVGDNLLRDVASFESWVREDLTRELVDVAQTKLFSGAGSGSSDLLGITTNAVDIDGALIPSFAGAVTSPTEIDCVLAAIAQIAASNFMADTVVLNSEIFYKIMALKNADNDYLAAHAGVYFENGVLYIGGVRVVVSNVVPSTHLLAFQSGLYKCFVYEDVVIEAGLNGTDFSEDQTSFRAYWRAITYLPSTKADGVFYDAFADVEAVLQAS